MRGGWCKEVDEFIPNKEVESAVGIARPGVDSLEAGIIPKRQFPLRRWYYANPLWYYHAPASEHRLRTDRRFYELVDPLLRPLCRTLFEAGLLTTPSCQGHFYGPERFERIWSELSREAEAIRHGGLAVKDSENDEMFEFRDAAYRLPWKSFADFHAEASRHQTMGYIGIAAPERHSELVDRLAKNIHRDAVVTLSPDPELTEALGCRVLNVFVDAGSPVQRDKVWGNFTRSVTALLSDRAVDS